MFSVDRNERVTVSPTLARVVDELVEVIVACEREGDVLSKVMLLPLVSDDTSVP